MQARKGGGEFLETLVEAGQVLLEVADLSRPLVRVAWLMDADGTPPQSLVLEGRHHFSRYRLTFEIQPHGRGSAVAAVTHAEFPGLKGRAYRALIIGTGLHVVVTNRMLRAVKDRAERDRA